MIGAKALSDLVTSLLIAISGYTGYAVPAAAPVVSFVPHEVLEERACKGPCPALGFTASDGVIFLDERLPVGDDPAATSILVHELTHYLQRAGSRISAPIDCTTWMEREREAYDVQYRWLRDTAANLRDLSGHLQRLGTHPMVLSCGPVPQIALPPGDED